MAIRITTTHCWSKLFVPITWISRLVAVGIVISLMSIFIPDEGYWGLLYFVAFIATIVVHGVTVEQWYHIVQTYLYIKITLGVDISFNEASHFLLLFAPTEIGTWYPMTGIKEVPQKYRRQILFESARKIFAEHGLVFGLDFTEDQHVATATDSKDYLGEDISSLLSGFDDLVAMLCKMAKGDGIITQEEIDVIDDFFMNILKLTPDQREKAINIFEKAKKTETPFEVYAREFNRYHKNNKELLESVVDLLTCIAVADGILSAEEEILLNQAISIFEVKASHYHEYKSTYNRRTSMKDIGREEEYVKVLGLQDEITPDKIKSAYRKLAVKYHPDKVSHLGSKIREVAEIEMKKINEAYEFLQNKYAI